MNAAWNDKLLIQNLEDRVKWLGNTIRTLKKRLKEAPEGNLVVSQKSGKNYYYRVRWKGNIKIREYIPVGDTLIKLLAQKTYDKKELNHLEEEAKKTQQLIAYLKSHHSVYEKTSEVRRQWVTPVFLPDLEFKAIWENDPYLKNTEYSENLIHPTKKGDLVRSKSEVLIANSLYDAHIPYRYEAALTLGNGIIIHPDFTIMKMSCRREIYWDHFGMMDQPEYLKSALRKINSFEMNGFLEGSDLIFTFESSKNNLDLNVIKAKIQNYCR